MLPTTTNAKSTAMTPSTKLLILLFKSRASLIIIGIICVTSQFLLLDQIPADVQRNTSIIQSKSSALDEKPKHYYDNDHLQLPRVLSSALDEKPKSNNDNNNLRLPRVLAFVFPQFHQDPLNDKFWGEGFTDWNNLQKASQKNRKGSDITTRRQSIVQAAYKEKPERIISTSSKPRLELLHIQKNAGSLFEELALQQNISWGICHFAFPWKGRTPYKNCPPLRKPQSSKTCYWHYPLQYLAKDGFLEINPYDNHLDAAYVARPKKFFAVVRNPYDRLISMFYTSNENTPNKIRGTRGKLFLNSWIQNVVQDGSTVGLMYPNSTICQYQYFYDDNNNAGALLVNHIVQFEYLAQDFNPLAKRYGLNISVPTKKTNANKKSKNAFTIKDINNQTIHMINTVCSKDFNLGRGYSKIEVTVQEAQHEKPETMTKHS